MIPLVVLLVSFVVFWLAGLAVPWFAPWQHALRAALGVMFLLAASAHWGKRRPDLVRMIPRSFGSPGFWVTITGIAEILIAAGLQLPVTARPAALLAALMLLAIFPANVKAARERLTLGGRPVPRLGPRIAIQVVFLAAVLAAAWPW